MKNIQHKILIDILVILCNEYIDLNIIYTTQLWQNKIMLQILQKKPFLHLCELFLTFQLTIHKDNKNILSTVLDLKEKVYWRFLLMRNLSVNIAIININWNVIIWLLYAIVARFMKNASLTIFEEIGKMLINQKGFLISIK